MGKCDDCNGDCKCQVEAEYCISSKDKEVPEPWFPADIGHSKLESYLQQKLKVPFEFNDTKYEILISYIFHKDIDGRVDKRKLNIEILYLNVPSASKGLFAEFDRDDFYETRGSFGLVRCKHDTKHNPTATKFFIKYVQPVLERNLPNYMSDLIYFKPEQLDSE